MVTGAGGLVRESRDIFVEVGVAAGIGVISVVTEHDKHGPGRVVVPGDAVHISGAVGPVTFVPTHGLGNGHNDDFGGLAGLGIDVFRVVRLVRQGIGVVGGAAAADEFGEEGVSGGVDLVRGIGRIDLIAVGIGVVRVILTAPADVIIGHKRPGETFCGQDRNDAFREAHLRREKSSADAGVAAPGVRIDVFLNF